MGCYLKKAARDLLKKSPMMLWIGCKPRSSQKKLYHYILTDNELEVLTKQFREKWLSYPDNLLSDLRGQFSSDNEIGLYEEFLENIEQAEEFFFPDGRTDELSSFYQDIGLHISKLQDDEPSSSPSDWSTQVSTSARIAATSAAANSSTIFDDVDD